MKSEVEFLALPPGEAELSVLGGITLELSADTSVLLANSCAILEHPDYAGPSPFKPYVLLAEVRFKGSAQTPIDGVEGFLALYDGQPTPGATGRSISALSADFDEYRVDGAFPTQPREEDIVNCSTEEGVTSDLSIIPAIHSDFFVSERDDGLLLLAASAFTADEQVMARELFDELLPTLRSSGT